MPKREPRPLPFVVPSQAPAGRKAIPVRRRQPDPDKDTERGDASVLPAGGGANGQPWWIRFASADTAEERAAILRTESERFFEGRLPYTWAGNDFASSLLKRHSNPIDALRNLNGALEEFTRTFRWSAYHQDKSSTKEAPAETDPQFAEFLTGPEAETLRSSFDRDAAEDLFIDWLTSSEKQTSTRHDPEQYIDLDVKWYAEKDRKGIPVLHFEALATSRTMKRKARSLGSLKQYCAEWERNERPFSARASAFLSSYCRTPEASSRWSVSQSSANDTSHRVHEAMLWLTDSVLRRTLTWRTGEPVEFHPDSAHLILTSDPDSGKSVWAIRMPHAAGKDWPENVEMANAEIMCDAGRYDSSTDRVRIFLKHGAVLLPLDAGGMPHKVLARVWRNPELPAEKLKGRPQAAALAKFLQRLPMRIDETAIADEVPVSPTLQFRISNQNYVYLSVTARADRGERFVREPDGQWIPQSAEPAATAPDEEVVDLQEEQTALPGQEPADDDTGASPQKARTKRSANALFVTPRRADIEPVEEWLTALVPPNAFSSDDMRRREIVWKLTPEAGARLLALWPARPGGAEYLGDPRFRNLVVAKRLPGIRIRIEPTGTKWFTVSVALESDAESLSVAAILDALRLAEIGSDMVRLSSGRLYPRRDLEEYRRKLELLASFGLAPTTGDSPAQQLHAFQLAAARPMLEGMVDLSDDFSPLVRAAEKAAKEFEGIPHADVPPDIAAFLRHYQADGVDFLAWAGRTFGGAILADDMGLGKTLQMLAAISTLRAGENAGENVPSIVVCPASVAHNWQREAAKFAPSLKVAVIERGGERKAILANLSKYDLIVTNYALLRREASVLKEQPWLCVVVDEAQAIKNPKADITSAIKKLEAAYRFALTGTPIENRLTDLWSIADFALPGYLGSVHDFADTFGAGVDADPLVLPRLRAKLRPVMIRRMKAEVAPELPDRIEERMDCEMTSHQRVAYAAEVKRTRLLLKGLDGGDQLAGQGRIQILAALTRLRQLCCDPLLLGLENKGSGKVDEFLRLIPSLLEAGHKVLVFSQFVKMLNLLRGHLEQMQVPFYMLTGQTTKRQAVVERFENDATPSVFLISLKAGGTGLNLVSASHVILFDPWWNPAVEAQAIDRSHRIGQDKTVVAFRLVTEGTVEERIFELQERKRNLTRGVLDEEAFNRTLAKEDFEFLLSEHPEAPE